MRIHFAPTNSNNEPWEDDDTEDWSSSPDFDIDGLEEDDIPDYDSCEDFDEY